MKSLPLLLLTGLILLGAYPASATQDAKAKDPLYQISYKAPEAVKVGTEAPCNLTITPKEGWVLKTETPFKLELAAKEGVTLPRVSFSSKDFVDPQEPAKTVATLFNAQKAGKHGIDAKLTFFVCSDSICKRQKDTAQCTFDALKN